MAIAASGPIGWEDDSKESGCTSKIKRGAGGLAKEGETSTQGEPRERTTESSKVDGHLQIKQMDTWKELLG